METDSMWLQKSLNLADPFEESRSSGASNRSTGAPVTASEIESLASRPAPALENRHPDQTSKLMTSLRAPSSMRMSSIANALSNFSPFEVDDLKARVAQLNREKLKWEDSLRDLERTRAELERAREDYRILEEYTQKVQGTSDECTLRAERDGKARQEAESRLLEATRAAGKEQQALKAQIDEVKKQHAHAEFELRERLEGEKNEEIARLLTEHEAAVNVLETKLQELESSLASTTVTLQQAEAMLQRSAEQLSELQRKHSESMDAAEEQQRILKDQLVQEAKHAAHREATLRSEHAEALEVAKMLAAEELHVARCEAKAQLDAAQMKHQDVEHRLEKTKDELFTVKGHLQSKEAELERQAIHFEGAIQKERDDHHHQTAELRAQHKTAETAWKSQTTQLEHELKQSNHHSSKVEAELASLTKLHHNLTNALESAQSSNALLESKLQSAVCDIESRETEIEELSQLIERMSSEKDQSAQAYTEDLQELRSRAHKSEEELSSLRAMLSSERKAHLAADSSYRKTIADLRAQLNDNASKAVFEHTEEIHSRHSLQLTCDSLSEKLALAERERTMYQGEAEELKHRIQQLEASLQEMQQRAAKRPREMLSELGSNVAANASREASLKRAYRPEKVAVQRVFAVSGFEGEELHAIRTAIQQLPNAKLVECRSNAPIPDQVTHLVASGQLTIKLLTAAAKGCWIVKKEFILESLDNGDWLSESECGCFKQSTPPLQGQRLFFSSNFKSSKHYATAKLLAEQGGATFTQNPNEADVVLTTFADDTTHPLAHTWERLVNRVYPIHA